MTGVFYPHTDADDLHRRVRRLRHREGHHRAVSADRGRGSGLAHLAAAPGHGGGRRRVRRRRHLRRRARAARHDDRRRGADRPAAAGGADRQRLPARLRRDAAADRPDRRPARTGAGPGDGARALRPRLADHDAGLRHAEHRRRPVPPGRRRRRTGAGDPRAGRRPLPGRAPRRPARRGLGRPGDRLRARARSSARPCSPSPTGGRSSRSTSPSGWCSPPRSARSRRRGDPRASDGTGPTSSGCSSLLATFAGGAVVFLRPSAADARPHVGPALHPVRRRRSLADPDRRGRRSPRSSCCSRGAGSRPARCSTCAAGAACSSRPTWSAPCCSPLALGGVILAFATADPKVEVFSPRGRWYLLGAARRGRRLHLARTPRRQPARAARRPASYAGVGGAAGQLLRRCRADRRPHRHPAVRPHHRLPRRPAARRPGARAVPARAAGGRRGRRLPDPLPLPRARHRDRHAAGRRPGSC